MSSSTHFNTPAIDKAGRLMLYMLRCFIVGQKHRAYFRKIDDTFRSPLELTRKFLRHDIMLAPRPRFYRFDRLLISLRAFAYYFMRRK